MIFHIKEELSIFLLAVQFLTRLPIPWANLYTAQRLASGPRYYPAVGLIIGGIVATVYWAALYLFEPIMAVLLATAVSLLITGAFHEDGLADTFDGIGGGADQARTLEIMKDSRVGVYGLSGLTLVLALKIAALASMTPALAIIAMVSANALSRLSSVLVIASSEYVREEGLGKPTAVGISQGGLAIALMTGSGALVCMYVLSSSGIVWTAMIGLTLGQLLSRALYEKRLGGYTGDCLGATQQITEVAIYLALLACLSL